MQGAPLDRGVVDDGHLDEVDEADVRAKRSAIAGLLVFVAMLTALPVEALRFLHEDGR